MESSFLVLVIVGGVEREQRVEPFEFVRDKLKPPSKNPHVMPAVLSRSPILVPPNWTVSPVTVEQVSPTGSESLTSVSPPLPSPIVAPPGLLSIVTPLVCPEIRLIAPSGEGPKLVP